MNEQPFWQWTNKYGERTAVIESTGKEVSYQTLENKVAALRTILPARQLIFCFCENSISSLVGYLASLQARTVPLMLDSGMEKSFVDGLCSVWQPGFIWQPATLPLRGKVLLSMDGYVLVETGAIPPVMPEMLGLLMTTSGSTGSPKLVRQTYKNLQANCNSIIEYLGITSNERPTVYLPMNYVFGLSIINSHLACGATLLMTNQSPLQKDFWSFVREQQATSLSGVPYTFEILAKLRFMRMSLPALTTLTQAGGKLSPVLQGEFAAWAQAHKKRFFVMYGACEATSRMGYLPAELCVEKNGAMGRAIPGGRFELHDEHGQVITAPGTVGELVYFGDNVTLGYAVCREDLAREDDNHGQLVTGDMARVDQDGIYTIVGRKKRFLKVFGNRVGLDDIEQRVKGQFPGLECAAGGEDDHVRIYITQPEQADAVRHFLVTTFQFHHSAFEVRVRDEIPKNAAGKTLYAQLETS